MKSAPFVLHQPKTVAEALSTLAETCDEGGMILAGGQSLVPMMALRVAYPPHLIDINGIDTLSELHVTDGMLVIGATVRHARFHAPVEDGVLGRLLAAVSRNIAHYPIRMRGTFCGSLAHADPSSEWCLVAATLDARIDLASASGERELAAADYLAGAMTTTREADEMLTAVRLPILSSASTFGFYEFNRRAGDFALGMSLTAFEISGGVMTNVRVGLGGIEEKPRRLVEVEALLEGQVPSDDRLNEAAAAAIESVDPMEDVTTTADYRRDLTGVVVRRALRAALAVEQKTD